MPNAVQTIAGTAVAAGAGTNPAVPAAGDTFTVPSFSLTAAAYLEQVSAAGATTDFVRIRSPRLHDANQGIRAYVGSPLYRSLLPWNNQENLYPSDTPTVEIDATGAGTGGILVTYGFDDLAGAQPRLGLWSEIEPRIVHISSVEVDVTSGAAGQWGNGVAINALFDNFEAGADYALLGYHCNANCLGVAITGKDTGNLKIGGPGSADAIETREYFIWFAERTQRQRIPIIAANNKGSTLVQNVDTAAATAVKVSLTFAQLQ